MVLHAPPSPARLKGLEKNTNQITRVYESAESDSQEDLLNTNPLAARRVGRTDLPARHSFHRTISFRLPVGRALFSVIGGCS